MNIDLWVPGILSCSLAYLFSFSSVIATFEVDSCIFVLKCFNCFKCPFPFCFVITFSAIKSDGNCKAMNIQHKITISDNLPILLSLFAYFDFDPVLSHYIATYYTHWFFVILTLKCFYALICLNSSRSLI